MVIACCPSRKLPSGAAVRSHLQWRDRAGIAPASLLTHVVTHEDLCVIWNFTENGQTSIAAQNRVLLFIIPLISEKSLTFFLEQKHRRRVVRSQVSFSLL